MRQIRFGGLEISVVLTVIAAAFFLLFPRLDLSVSALFYDPARGFYLESDPALAIFREIMWTGSELIFLGFLALLILGALRARWRFLPLRETGFAVTSVVLGPGLLVNAGLKAYWGRARPHDVTEFGGALSYSPPLEISDQCQSNCSFVSGEASMIVATALILYLIGAPRVSGRARLWLAISLTVLAAATSALRILFGGHFLSDVIFAGLFSAIIVFAMQRFFLPATRRP